MMSPETLLKGIAEGERKYEKYLVSHYSKSLLIILRQQTTDVDTALDIAQDTFAIVIEKARNRGIQKPEALARFIRNTAINILIEQKRKETRRKTDMLSDIDASVTDVFSNIEQSVSKQQVKDTVMQVINELPVARDKQILINYFVKGEDKDMLCRLLEVSPEHFDKLLYRARQRLKQALSLKLNLQPNELTITKLLFTLGLIVFFTNKSDIHMRDIGDKHHLTIKSAFLSVELYNAYSDIKAESRGRSQYE